MKLESINQTISSLIEKLPSQETIKNKAIEIANKITQYISATKLFYAATILFTIAATTNPFAGLLIGETIVAGALTASVLHSVSLLFGFKGLSSKEYQNEMDVASGITNLCSWFLCPPCGVATALFSLGFQATALSFRKISEIRKAHSNSSIYSKI